MLPSDPTGSDSPAAWPLESSERVHEYAIFDVRHDRARSPRTGELHDFYVVDAPDAVVVVALTPGDELVMVEQYRHGIREVTLELPAGILDGDDPEAGGRRELREETGYELGAAEVIGVMEQNPSWETTRVHVLLIPRARLPALVAEGTISSAVAIAALHLFEARRARA